MNKKISPSIMCVDFFGLEKCISDFEKYDIDLIHVDIMDGCFVPNFTLGTDFVKMLKKNTDIPLDIHMMVNEPSKFIDRMNLSENDILCVHYESEIHIHRVLEMIKKINGGGR